MPWTRPVASAHVHCPLAYARAAVLVVCSSLTSTSKAACLACYETALDKLTRAEERRER